MLSGVQSSMRRAALLLAVATSQPSRWIGVPAARDVVIFVSVRVTPSRRRWPFGCLLEDAAKARHQMQERYPTAHIIGLDWSGAMLNQSRHRSNSAPKPFELCADMHALPLASHSMDVVFSNLALQWTNDPVSLLLGLRRVLKPGGMFLFTTFGPDTLCELRGAWSQADECPHVNRFSDMHEIGDLMVQTGFTEPVMDMEKLTLEYRDVIGLMRELKAIGTHNAATGRNPGLTGKDKFAKALESYEEYRRHGVYPATFEVIYGVAFGPEEGQPFRTPEGEMATFSVETLRSARKRPNHEALAYQQYRYRENLC